MINDPIFSGEKILKQLDINPYSLRIDFPIREQRLQYRAVINWLTKYRPRADANNLEKVHGLLESFYHLCEAKAWDKASQVMFLKLNTPNNLELHQQLEAWGYHEEQLRLYKKIVNNLNPELKTVILSRIQKLE
jgi:hypothetical protein